MSMLGKVTKLLLDIPEEDLGVIYDLLERLNAQKRKGVKNLLCDLKGFLRQGGILNRIVDFDSDPVGAWQPGRILWHYKAPAMEFDPEMFELVKVDHNDAYYSKLWDLHNELVGSGKRPVNINLIQFLQGRSRAIFPEEWKNKFIVLLGTGFREQNPKKQKEELRPLVRMILPVGPHELSTGYLYMNETIPRSDIYALCLKS